MIREPVNSSNVVGIGWEGQALVDGREDRVGDLEVEFASGAVYRYFGISYYRYRAVVDAASVGRALRELVTHTDPPFAYERVKEEV